MRVFVTGGTGYLGTHVVAHLLRARHHVTVLARDPRRMPPELSVEIVRGDLESSDALRDAMDGHDACIHLAIVWRDDPNDIGLDDVRACTNVFRAAAAANVGQILYTSSTAVHRPFVPQMNESMRIAPTDFYGATKAANEAFLSALSWTTDTRCNVIRPGPIVGPPAVEGSRTVVYRRLEEILESARRGEEIHVRAGEGRQLVDVRDVAKLACKVIDANVNRETYLAVATEIVTWEEIARAAVEAARSHARVVVDHTPATPHSFDVTKIARDFGLVFHARESVHDIARLARHT